MLPQQLARASGYRTMPTRCPESPGAIHFMIRPLVVALHPQIRSIFAIQTSEVNKFPTLICSHCSQPGPMDIVLCLLDVLNLLVLFISWSDHWLLLYSHKHYQFSEFRLLRWKNSLHWYAPTAVSHHQWMSYCACSMCSMSWCHPFLDAVTGCCARAINITNFRNSECPDKGISHIDMLLLWLARAMAYRTRPIQWAQSPRAIHFMIRVLAAEIQQQTSPIFEIQDCKMKECPTLICSHYRQAGAVDGVQGLFNQLNLLVPSILPYDPQLGCYRHKHHQFSEFEMPRW